MSVMRRTAKLSVLIPVFAIATSCGSSQTSFPAGLEPWETNAAMPPAPMPGNEFPETLTFVTRHWGDGSAVLSVHAKAFIQMPIAAVAHAARDPQTGFDPTASDGFTVEAFDVDPTYTWSFRTHVTTHAFVVVDWWVQWREGVVEGTVAAPTVYAVRWQKTDGNSGIEVMEGSLVLRQVDGHPEATAVEYEYHLKAPFSSFTTITNYLTSIFGRLRDDAHGRTLSPIVCTDCVTAPANY